MGSRGERAERLGALFLGPCFWPFDGAIEQQGSGACCSSHFTLRARLKSLAKRKDCGWPVKRFACASKSLTPFAFRPEDPPVQGQTPPPFLRSFLGK